MASMAIPLVIAGYPLVETLRTCQLQTAPTGAMRYGRAPIGCLSKSARQWTHEDRDIVTPANDLLYFSAWVNLKERPACLTVPAVAGRYFVVELLDAYTENFHNLGARNVPPEGGKVCLTGPSTTATPDSGHMRVQCPTDLVWIVGRVLVSGTEDLEAAREILDGFRLESSGALPGSVRFWHETGDAALDFFANFLQGLDDFPVPGESRETMDFLLVALGLQKRQPEGLTSMNPRAQEGLRAAFANAMAIIEAHTVSQVSKSWGYTTRLGKWNGNLLLRATAAMKGLGALCAEETIYALSDFDEASEPLTGARRYTMQFPAGALPPADAFWSVTLYGEDRFLIDNPIARYSVGDRTEGLIFDSDGSLTIPIQHAPPPTHSSNWLPAPAGAFYLILRCYHPRDELLKGRYVVPALKQVVTK